MQPRHWQSVGPELVNAARERSRKVILAFVEKHDWNNILNLDETVLFYKLLPNSTLASERKIETKVDTLLTKNLRKRRNCHTYNQRIYNND
jgi:hypothetical protein